MNLKPLILTLTLLAASVLSAQTVQQFAITKSGKVIPSAVEEKWNANLQHMEMPSVNGSGEKAKLLRMKQEQQKKYPRKSTTLTTKDFNNSLGSNVFSSVEGFEGNDYNNRVPNDNTIAISNDGILVSAINSKYLVYDTQADTTMEIGYLNQMVTPFGIPASRSKYDPKLTYDPNEDRFILSFLIGNIYQTSQIAMCFSITNNPIDGWHIYFLDGNALGTNHWTDYPAMIVNEDEVFLTGNLLENNTSWQTGFHESIIWQIDKWGGYRGDTSLNFQVWSGLLDDTIKIRNIHPVEGARSLSGPKQYFLSNKNFSAESDTVYLISIDNTLASGSAQIDIKPLSTPDHYFLAPNAQQSITKELATNDSRVLGAVVDGDWIQYVHNTLDTANGTCAVYHGTIRGIDSPTPIVSGVTISDTVMDLGYPNIASSASAYGDEECVIGFNFTSPVDTNGVACVYYNNTEEYSNIIKLKTGDAPIDILSGTLDRWGDYFGIQRKFNEPCSIWLAGMYGKTNENGCWISNVRTSSFCEENFTNVDETSSPHAQVFPNPVHDVASIDFDWPTTEPGNIKIVDLSGKLITTLYEDLIKKGANRISFFVDHLPSGIYFIQVSSEHHSVTKKFIVE
ncbi:T9SS type A sorting domain-containing protein [Parvicella tangerina]|uniref:Secretion system C-terminal sorting domain-containing protein n=1 Tax=Parvicella tangerina TaxID=2829795 RepID=A0A916NH99_9FLAO|nr:T9SS type A sorting domain-containing protein [Parvicella tangerina]CAG5082506.1 hypothetical protein CRYO30217_01936 [Parvicella tangerina]